MRSIQNLKKSSSWFGPLLSKCTKHEEDFEKFCVLLKESELYILYARNTRFAGSYASVASKIITFYPEFVAQI